MKRSDKTVRLRLAALALLCLASPMATPPEALGQSLSEAVDFNAATWSTYGSASWFGQSSVGYLGGDAAQSGNLTHSQSATLEIPSFSGPGTLSWTWKVSSEQGFDYLSFYLDGGLHVRISGETGWQTQSIGIAAGAHSIRWIYSLDGSVYGGQNLAWVDAVQWTPAGSPGAGGGTSLPLAEALDTPSMTWATSGASAWFGQSSVSANGDAAQAGTLTHNQANSLETIIQGPGTVGFSWRISSEPNHDFLRVTVSGSEILSGISGEVGWTSQTLSIPAGSHVVRWTYATDSSVLSGANTAWVDAVQFTPGNPQSATSSSTVALGEALDATTLGWSTSGAANWIGQQQVFHQGGDAARAGTLTHSQMSELTSTATGPAQLSFAWKVSSESGFDHLKFYVDGLLQDSISGEVPWTQRAYTIAPGNHLLRWVYSTDGSVLSGSNTGWLDAVALTTTIPPPPPLSVPSSSSDLVWRHRAAGWNGIWYMNNAILERSVLSVPETLSDLDWTIVGVGDVNQDGQNDWVWQHRTLGLIAFWFMNGQTQIGSALASPSTTGDLNWKIVGVADFDLDGRPDLVFQHATARHVAIWHMVGVAANTTTLIYPNSTGENDWAIKGVGDFNNDGRPDLLWQHASIGLLAIWHMNNAIMVSSTLLTPNTTGDLGWDLIDSGDFDRDGRLDIVFEHQSSAQIGIWHMNGATRVGTAFTTPPVPDSTAWQIQAIGHFNYVVPDTDGDGMLDTWETSYFAGLQEHGGGDWDADGFSNLSEFQAGTNPIAELGLQVFTLLK